MKQENYYNEIKNELLNNEINRKVKDYSKNKGDLETYYNVGKLLSEAGKQYGENIIGKYSFKLVKEVGKKYNITHLKRIRQFYRLIKKGAAVRHQLSWTHYRELIPLKDINEINYYIFITEQQNLSSRNLRERIKSREYERLDNDTKNKLIKNEETKVMDFIKDPIIIKSNNAKEIITEKVLHKLIMEDISSFMKELGNDFSFVDSEYKIKIGDTYNYIDLLLYNIKFNCYIVVELKVTELKKEHIGQIEVYMNYIDKNLKTLYQEKTIGIIIVKKNNKFVMEYCSDKRIISKEYKVYV